MANELHRSSIPYVGNKFKIYDQLSGCIPKNIETLRDVFCGGGVFSINTKAKRYVLTDISKQLVELHNAIRDAEFCNRVFQINHDKKYDKDDYLKMRTDYNNNKSPELLLSLLFRSFSNQMRFNKYDDFNMPFGQRNSFNWPRLTNHHNFYKNNDVVIQHTDFREALENVDKDDFVFLDPPYLNSTATYNEGWSESDEAEMYELIDGLKCKWMLTNTVYNRGVTNKLLEKFMDKYNVHVISSSFNYERFRKTDSAKQEIIVFNYTI